VQELQRGYAAWLPSLYRILLTHLLQSVTSLATVLRVVAVEMVVCVATVTSQVTEVGSSHSTSCSVTDTSTVAKDCTNERVIICRNCDEEVSSILSSNPNPTCTNWHNRATLAKNALSLVTTVVYSVKTASRVSFLLSSGFFNLQ
jgi:hypothetical protein